MYEDLDDLRDISFPDKWDDMTDVKHSHIRKKYFKTYVNYGRHQIVNIFPAYTSKTEECLFHVITQNSFTNITDSEYKIMSTKYIKKTLGIDLNSVVIDLIKEL